MAETGRALPRPAGETPMITSCDRRITVKCLRLPTAGRPISRVTLDLGPGSGSAPGAWAALTTREARELARRLLDQAALAEREAATAPGALPSPPSSASFGPASPGFPSF
ncbi:hypothetical protein [Streptomyces radiopugnans]|uniref:hypothetical protein n=1 Tax=Streptomyces radiopugnans TaxID=403935 RepID=UPI003F19CBDA